MTAQISFFDELIVDNFAGGGGASTGIELATGRVVDYAINHDPDAIRMHTVNHPHTVHLQASVWDVDPVELCRGRPVGLAWFSPDCKHFSKAKGAALVDRNIRGLAWIVLRWAGTVRPRVIILENVEEFVTWGPVRRGHPVKAHAGETFRQWKRQLMDLGYAVDHRELVAADYGAPTIRKRFVLVARCDGRPIVWPERTHAPADSPEVRAGKLLPWRSAAEIIDWSLPMYSIFATKDELRERYGVNAVRPLAENTLRRIIRGVDKFTIRSGKPFLVPTGYGERKGQAPRVHDIDKPVPTVVGSGKHNLCTAQLIQYHTEQTERVRANGLTGPMQTIDSSNRYGLISASLTEYYGNGNPIDLREPMRTATSHDREALCAVHLDKYFAGGYKCAGNRADEPVTTITQEPRHSLCAAHVCKYYGGVVGADAVEPLPTVTGIDHNALGAAHVVKFKGQNIGQAPDEPLHTLTAGGGEFGTVSTVIRRYQPGEDLGYWPHVRELLNRHCGYELAEDEILLLQIDGTNYYIRDILLRMLQPRELYNAMGFPPDYIIDRDAQGRAYGKTAQVARCGNAVCPPVAEAVVRANYKAAERKIRTMAELADAVSI